ncbi:excinuclease ABC subunit UvrA [Schlesneria sp. T3-172]|uniref:excinuclease ABC subunit UvrA n=1 Tax=Schlesneria sphaerica TaxID=3373610 RepID=UPI0037C9FB9D
MQHPLESSPFPPHSTIQIVGARTHNLRNLNVEIPTGKLTVITGVSGSGKSSLAFDTIFAEGRRRYLSSVSSNSRTLLQETERPDVDFIEGLPPVLSVSQQMSGARRRSTVATASDIYDYLRILYARVGKLHCPQCGQRVVAQSRTEIVNRITQSLERQKVMVLSPIVRDQSGAHADVFSRIVKDGYVRARVDGVLVDAATPPALEKAGPHDIDIVIDRLILKRGVESRLEESVDLALQLGHGQCVISEEIDGQWHDRLYSNYLACPGCDLSFPPVESRSFSFNSHAGACSTCHGLGELTHLSETSDESTIPEGNQLPLQNVPASCDRAESKQKRKLHPFRSKRETEARRTCDACLGTRLGALPRAVHIDGINIAQFCSMVPERALEQIQSWHHRFAQTPSDTQSSSAETVTEAERLAARHILPEIESRLTFLLEVGLGYLTLDRGCETLSAGELQRTRLAACLGSELNGVCYILDEPTAGLHSSDTKRLMKSLLTLRDAGNTVVLVEHDLEVVRTADYVIDLGPGAGSLGGQLLAAGSPDDILRIPGSITGQFLRARTEISAKSTRQKSKSGPENEAKDAFTPLIRLEGASLHNLKDVTVEIPLTKIVSVTGVSGSGKSSLIMQTLVPAIRQSLGERNITAVPYRKLEGVDQLTRLVRIDQSPLGRSSRSTPATYSGLWDEVRWVFARTKESRRLGFTSRNFSLTVPAARCRVCHGRGETPIDEKQFSDWRVRCPECHGRRFSPASLSILYRGRSVADVLEMSLDEAAKFFENFPRLAQSLTVFNELGLGYLKLGQSAATLSGGEAQRVKLGTELAKSNAMSGHTLFVLDEPTSGLHAADIQQLLHVLRRLVSEGHSVLVIEHNLEVISHSDWQIDVGPLAGPEGGTITYAGLPNAYYASAH